MIIILNVRYKNFATQLGVRVTLNVYTLLKPNILLEPIIFFIGKKSKSDLLVYAEKTD